MKAATYKYCRMCELHFAVFLKSLQDQHTDEVASAVAKFKFTVPWMNEIATYAINNKMSLIDYVKILKKDTGFSRRTPGSIVAKKEKDLAKWREKWDNGDDAYRQTIGATGRSRDHTSVFSVAPWFLKNRYDKEFQLVDSRLLNVAADIYQCLVTLEEKARKKESRVTLSNEEKARWATMVWRNISSDSDSSWLEQVINAIDPGREQHDEEIVKLAFQRKHAVRLMNAGISSENPAVQEFC